MQYSSINDIPWPELGDEPDIESFGVKPAVDVLDNRLFPRFGSASSRDLKISSPVQGMVCYVTGLGMLMYSSAGVWVPFPGTLVMKVRMASFPLLTDDTPYDVAFDTQDYAPYGGHSTITNPTRMTPTFPGWYQFTGAVGFPTDLTPPDIYEVHALGKKNGNTITGAHEHQASNGDNSATFSCIVSLNGTSDYLELEALHRVGVDATPNMLTSSLIYLGPGF